VARISRHLAIVVGVYRGGAGVESAGRPASIPALRQRTVPAPGLPSRPTPISFSDSDPWDQRFLGEAIDLGNQLVATSRGFTNPPGVGPGSSVDLFLQILPRLIQPGFDASLIDPTRAPGETLVGAAITLEGTKSTFADRWRDVFTFHDDGAPWGLVALDQGVSREPLLSTIDGAIRRLSPATSDVAAPPGTGTGTATTPSRVSPAPVRVPTLPSRSPSPSPSGPTGSTPAGDGGAASSGGSGTASTGDSTPEGNGGTATTPEPYGKVDRKSVV
jgi:hypothetical protein